VYLERQVAASGCLCRLGVGVEVFSPSVILFRLKTLVQYFIDIQAGDKIVYIVEWIKDSNHLARYSLKYCFMTDHPH
jgi:hypothetical protein